MLAKSSRVMRSSSATSSVAGAAPADGGGSDARSAVTGVSVGRSEGRGRGRSEGATTTKLSATLTSAGCKIDRDPDVHPLAPEPPGDERSDREAATRVRIAGRSMDSEQRARGKVLVGAEHGVDCVGKSSAYFGAARPPFAGEPAPGWLAGAGRRQGPSQCGLDATAAGSAHRQVQPVAGAQPHAPGGDLPALGSEQCGAFAAEPEVARGPSASPAERAAWAARGNRGGGSSGQRLHGAGGGLDASARMSEPATPRGPEPDRGHADLARGQRRGPPRFRPVGSARLCHDQGSLGTRL